MKKCSGCQTIQNFANFHSHRRNPDGLEYACKTCVSIRQKIIYQKNKIKRQLTCRLYKKNNAKKIALYNEQYRKNNLEITRNCPSRFDKPKIYARNAKRRANKKLATPKWLSKDDYRFIELFYKEAVRLSNSNTTYEVDHIIPLNGENVCGLHVPWNLQILTTEENILKSNKYE